MKKIGIICEYNPFHNGHVYHIEKIRQMYPDAIIIVVMSGNIVQRGEFSVLDKWEKTDIALDYVDLVVELPSIFTIQSADGFAYGAVTILNNLEVDKIVFGAESLNADDFINIAKAWNNDEFNKFVLEFLDEGINYPTALSKAVNKLTGIEIKKPNDLLGLSYVKEMLSKDIEPIVIKRTNDYHSKALNGKIVSATSIREALNNGVNVKDYVPLKSYEYLNNYNSFDCFNFLKYKIISEIDNLDKYLNVDEGIENRIKKFIYDCDSLEDLVNKVKTKRYTYNKIKRMFLCILLGITKKLNNEILDVKYVRVLGFNDKGGKYLKGIKKFSQIPIITNFTNKYKSLEFELRVSYMYYLNKKDKNYEVEYKHKPIIK